MRGGVVAYPTDTVYGLGCDPLNPNALRRLVKAKNRAIGQLPVLVDTLGRAEELARFNTTSITLARRFWPGPLTLVAPTRIRFPDLVTGATGFVGLRVPAHKDALGLIRSCGGALIGTSANHSGSAALRRSEDVASELGKSIDLVLDGRVPRSSQESTVVSIHDNSISFLREKSISREKIISVAGKSGG